jgi:excisionase family DNA binding protein
VEVGGGLWEGGGGPDATPALDRSASLRALLIAAHIPAVPITATQPSDALPPLCTVSELAAHLRVSARKVSALARAGEIASVELGRTRVFRAEAVEEFLAAKTRPAVTADAWGRSTESRRRGRRSFH